jgi:hypothetical protein
MYRVEHRVGRLFEARVFGLTTPAEVDAYTGEFTPELLGAVSGPVLCADHRPVVIYAPQIADMLVDLFNVMNKRWERVAIVVASTNATLMMQLQRIVRESGNPSRRVFVDAGQATEFLEQILNPAESARVAAFLAEPFGPSSAPIRSAR